LKTADRAIHCAIVDGGIADSDWVNAPMRECGIAPITNAAMTQFAIAE
jgi:hypothetical protein